MMPCITSNRQFSKLGFCYSLGTDYCRLQLLQLWYCHGLSQDYNIAQDCHTNPGHYGRPSVFKSLQLPTFFSSLSFRFLYFRLPIERVLHHSCCVPTPQLTEPSQLIAIGLVLLPQSVIVVRLEGSRRDCNMVEE